MLNIDPDTILELNKKGKQPIFLYTIFDYDGASDLHLAESKTDVVFDGVTYGASPITHDEVGENTQGEVDAVRVRISNVSRLVQSYLELYDFRNKKVRVRLVFRDRLAYPDEYVDFVFFIDSYSANQDVVDFVLMPKTDVLGAMLPARVYSRNYCQWKFKGTECAYSGGETTCNKTKQRCKVIGNYQRFGGFPSIPSRKVYIA
jgi:lambda family phage minor tail protein L